VKAVISIVLCAGLLGGAFVVVKLLAKFRPEAVIEERPRFLQTVEIFEALPSDVTVELPSQGLVQAVRTSVLAAEVSGRVAEVSPKFEVGERFATGEWIVRIDKSDYETALARSEADLAEARSALASEEARAEQALRDWKKISGDAPATDLVLRKPQLASANARVSASLAALEKARRDLERTTVSAPFAGRLRAKLTESGSFLAPGSPVAELASTEVYQIRLPLPLREVPFIDGKLAGTPVTLRTESGAGAEFAWEGRLLRTEGEVERSSRSFYLVAELRETGDPVADAILQPGLFLRAAIRGVTLKGVFRIPRSVFLDADRLLVIDAENRVRVRQVEVLRADGADLLVRGGLAAGERVCATSLAAPMDGMEVRLADDDPPPPPDSRP
jgi:RND family efflux transporter MFP subunit